MKYLSVLLLAISLNAMDFETFKQMALERSPQLKSFAMQHDVAVQEGELSLMYANPMVEIEASRFDAKAGGSDNGWLAMVEQPFRVPGLGDDLRSRSDARQRLAQNMLFKGRAGFVASLERAYTTFVHAKKMIEITDSEIVIAERMENIAAERYADGAATKAQMMQARLERMEAENRKLAWRQRSDAARFQMLTLAGMSEEISLDVRFLYPVRTVGGDRELESPDIALARSRSEALRAEAASQDYALREWNLYGEYEDEPDQAIARVGLSAALPFFNAGKQQARLTRLRATQNDLDAEQLARSQSVRLKALETLLKNAEVRFSALQGLQKQQQELLALYEEGYRLSGSGLLELILAKRRLVQTRKSLLDLERDANSGRIELNYLEGKYNE